LLSGISGKRNNHDLHYLHSFSLAPRAVIVNPEKRRAAQNLSLIAAVLLTRGIAQINK
jgi:hypothetical protein